MRNISLIVICLASAVLFVRCAWNEKKEHRLDGAILMSVLGILSMICVVLIVCL